MTYHAQNGMGSYYELSGFGGMARPSRRVFSGFGAVSFSADALWSDWLAGAGGNNAAGKRAADTLRAALGQLGYGPVAVGGMFADSSSGGALDKAAYGKFVSDNGVSPTPGMPAYWPNKAGIIKLAELVKAGGNPGGGEVQEFHDAGGTIVAGAAPGAKPLATASLSTGMMVGIAAAAVLGIGALALFAKKKGPGSSTSSSSGTRAA